MSASVLLYDPGQRIATNDTKMVVRCIHLVGNRTLQGSRIEDARFFRAALSSSCFRCHKPTLPCRGHQARHLHPLRGRNNRGSTDVRQLWIISAFVQRICKNERGDINSPDDTSNHNLDNCSLVKARSPPAEPWATFSIASTASAWVPFSTTTPPTLPSLMSCKWSRTRHQRPAWKIFALHLSRSLCSC